MFPKRNVRKFVTVPLLLFWIVFGIITVSLIFILEDCSGYHKSRSYLIHSNRECYMQNYSYIMELTDLCQIQKPIWDRSECEAHIIGGLCGY